MLNRFSLVLLVSLALSGSAQAVTTYKYKFTQDGYSSGGTVRGVFKGTDLDDDGRIYALSRGVSELFGLPFGNELDYAKVVFEGFADDPIVLTYNKAVADMEDPSNLFMAFAYNADGGSFGDEADEGWSFSFFAPSFNYQLGTAFSFFWNPVPLPEPTFVPCGTAAGPDFACAGLVEYIPDPTSPDGIAPGFTDFSNALIVGEIPVAAPLFLVMSGLGLLSLSPRNRRLERLVVRCDSGNRQRR